MQEVGVGSERGVVLPPKQKKTVQSERAAQGVRAAGVKTTSQEISVNINNTINNRSKPYLPPSACKLLFFLFSFFSA